MCWIDAAEEWVGILLAHNGAVGEQKTSGGCEGARGRSIAGVTASITYPFPLRACRTWCSE